MKISMLRLRQLISEELTVNRKNTGSWERWLAEDGEMPEEDVGKEIDDDPRASMGGDSASIPVESLSRASLKSIIREMILYERYETWTAASVEDGVDRALEILDIQNTDLRSLIVGIARVESGGSSSRGGTEITGHDADPFQLDKIGIENTRENVNLRRWRSWIDEKRGPKPSNLGSRWDQQSNSEIEGSTAMGAIAATLYVLWANKSWDPEKRNTYSFPSSVKAQAKFWKKHYNTPSGDGVAQDYIDKNS